MANHAHTHSVDEPFVHDQSERAALDIHGGPFPPLLSDDVVQEALVMTVTIWGSRSTLSFSCAGAVGVEFVPGTAITTAADPNLAFVAGCKGLAKAECIGI